MKDLIFNPVDHTYFVGDTEYTSVTTVLKELGLIDYGNIPAEVLKKAADRGKKVDTMIGFYLKGTLDEDTLDEQLKPYLNGLKKFLDNHDLKVFTMQEKLKNDSLKIAGALDCRGLLDGAHTIIDWKCVAKVKEASRIQLGGYKYLFNKSVKGTEEEVNKIMVVQIKKDGYALMPASWYSCDEEDEFFACAVTHQLKRRFGCIKKI